MPSSLSSIEARIEGPKGTVYSKGAFTIKIQIAERYPFQPPNVTFITPIYHPNIDNGGRICLDILNLPPKGAWQPSLNISTVLTSIGLLLGEPNPVDGLTAETVSIDFQAIIDEMGDELNNNALTAPFLLGIQSREYKYNRQAFDQKARSWTEKYANVQDTKRSNDVSFSAINPSMELGIEAMKADSSSESVANEREGSCKKLRLTGEKLSLKSKTPDEENRIEKENVPPSGKLFISHLQKPVVVNSSSSAITEHGKTHCEQVPPRDC